MLVNYADVDIVVAKALSLLKIQHNYINKLQREPPAIEHRGFLSHVQKYSADLCRCLVYGLEKKDTSVWHDMTAGRLDAIGMAHGVAICNYFVLIATKEYFTREWPIYELLIAQVLGKPIIVAIEADSRHGGMTFDECTKLIPKPWEFLKAHEFLKVERRGDFSLATLNELHKRLMKETPVEQKSSVRKKNNDVSKQLVESFDKVAEEQKSSVGKNTNNVSKQSVKSYCWNIEKMGDGIELHNDMVTISNRYLWYHTILGLHEFGKDHRQFSVKIMGLAPKGLIEIGVARPTFEGRVIFLSKVGWCYANDSWKNHNYSARPYGEAYHVGDIVTIEMDKGNMICYKNGNSQGIAFTNLSGPLCPAVCLGGKGTSVQWTTR